MWSYSRIRDFFLTLHVVRYGYIQVVYILDIEYILMVDTVLQFY